MIHLFMSRPAFRTRQQQTNRLNARKHRPGLEPLEDRYAPAVFNVNSLADILSPPAGTVTLRSAIQAANTNSDATNTINLTLAGTYAITLPGIPGEVDNAAGEFSIYSTNLTTGAAKTSLNIVNTSGGPVAVDGGRLNRVFDINASLQLGSVNITAGGSGFDATSGITFTAPTLSGGIQATGNLIISAGSVVGVQITNPGTGYTASAPPAITFTGPGTGAAGNIVLSSPAMTVSMSAFTIQNGLAQSGFLLAASTGGGIRDFGNANLTLTSMVVTGNTASDDGGGVAMENSSNSITDFTGGGTNPTLTINKCVIRDNHAGNAGGGIEADGSGNDFINAGSVIEGNTALLHGGGVCLDFIDAAVSSVTVTAGGSGYTSAPIVNFGGPGVGAAGFATISGGVITGVTITNSGTGYVLSPPITFIGGGGSGATATANMVVQQSPNLTMTGTLVKGNASFSATIGTNVFGSGGGISNTGNGAVTIIGSTVEDNFAGNTGGGLADPSFLGTVTINSSLFLNNSANRNGGGIFVTGSFCTLSSTSIQDNTANGSGGGICDGGLTLLQVSDSTISGNTASGNGGGIETGTRGPTVLIITSTIANNSALNFMGGTEGGGIDAPGGSSLDFSGDTITGNFADNGGGVFWSGMGGVDVFSTIIAKNIASTAGPDANNPAGTFTDHGGNLIGITDGSTGFTAPTTQTGTAANPLNPHLGPLQNNGGPTIGASARPGTLATEVPLAGSPVIDKGFAFTAPSTDERGYLRPDEGISELADVGAVEFLTSQERFVQALYLDELGRPGTLAELDGWVQVLNGSGGRRAVVAGIDGSFEARDRVVKGWYQTFLGRTAMNGEENFWAHLLATQTQEQTLSQILGSGEFFTHAQTLGFIGSANSQFIQALYSLLLNRTPGSPEINAWLNLLPMLGRQGVALDILQSQEYRTDTVQTDYIDLLHRIGDDLGVNFWVTSSLDLAKIRVSLESSLEFFGNG
jgi:hypothetical protein